MITNTLYERINNNSKSLTFIILSFASAVGLFIHLSKTVLMQHSTYPKRCLQARVLSAA